MITIEEIKEWRSSAVFRSYNTQFVSGICDLAIAQHEEIERLKRERDEAYERAAQTCDTEYIAPGLHFATCIRFLKSGEPK